MKACEEWLQRTSSGARVYTRDCKRAAWKAALEWVLKTAKELEERDAPIDMGDVIKQELEEG